MTLPLRRCTDPACPGCGCEQSRLIAVEEGWAGQQEVRECGACGGRWRIGARRRRCPKCLGAKTRVASTQSGPPPRGGGVSPTIVRWIKCQDCGLSWKQTRIRSMQSRT